MLITLVLCLCTIPIRNREREPDVCGVCSTLSFATSANIEPFSLSITDPSGNLSSNRVCDDGCIGSSPDQTSLEVVLFLYVVVVPSACKRYQPICPSVR